MRVRGKWALLASGVLVVLCVLGAGLYRWPIDSARVVAELNSATSPVGCLHWGKPGRASFRLLPWPALHVIDVELLDNKDVSVLSAPNAEIGLAPWGLLRGKFAPVSAKLLNPTALIDLDAARDGAEQIIAEPTTLLTRVEVEGGVAKIVSADLRLDTLIENVDGWLQWTKTDGPLSFSLSGVWRGEPLALEGRVASPLQLREGRPTQAVLKITARPAELAFAGSWKPGGKGAFEGDLTTRIRSLGTVERWLGTVSAPPIAAQEIALRGKAAGSFEAVTLSEARLDVGGQGFDGSLNFSRAAGRTSVSGTLAADTVDISALWDQPGPLLDASGQWSRQPLVSAPSETLDLDLRVSASHAFWRGHRIEAVAASVLQKDRRLTVRLLDAVSCQGQLSGEFSLQGAPDGLHMQAQASLTNGDIGAVLSEWGVTAYAGRGGYEGSLHASGASPAELAASLSGSATFELQAGTINGVNFEEALRRSVRRPVDFPRDMSTGETNFSSARARLEIADGQAQIVEARMEGPGAIVEARGAIDIAARGWRAWIEAMQASAVGEPSVDAARLTIGLFGPWSAPTMSAFASTN
jgi:AsmA protein